MVISADVILPVPNLSVVTSIAAADGFSSKLVPCSGDFELQHVLEDVSC